MYCEEEVLPVHFTTLRRTPFPHVLIEQQLLQMAGSGIAGSSFRKQVLQAAGWPHDGLVPFAKYPEQAATAFNRIREHLSADSNPEALMAALTAGK